MPQRFPATSATRTAALLACVGLIPSALAPAPAASADTARRFVHTTEADFEPGEADGFSVTAYGELVPVPAFEELPAPPESVENLLALARDDDALFAAGGTATGGARILRLAGDAWEELAAMEDAQVFCLLAADGRLLAGVSTEGASRVVSVPLDGAADDEPTPVVELSEDRYVWALVGGSEAVPLLVATGTEGRVLSADTAAVAEAAGGGEPAEATVVLDSAQANVLSLAASPDGFPVYAGTDTDGIVYRIDYADEDDPLAATAFFDAPEPEIGALAVAPDGRVYAGTADAEQARPGRLAGAASESTGRPEVVDAPGSPVGDSNDPDAPPPTPEPVELAAPEAPGSVAENAEATPSPAPALEREEAAEDAPAPDDADPGEAEPAPTPADYDALRETLREKLAEAKKTGTLEIEGVAAAADPKPSRPRTPDQPAAEKKEGNAVYELLADGSFREVFRETAMVLSLALTDDADRLLIGTGSEGQLHAVRLDDGVVTLVRDLDSQQVTALLPVEAGIAVAASNPAAAGRLPAGRPTGEAVYTSPTLDAGRRALFGRLSLDAVGPEGTKLRIETRSGSTLDPEAAPWDPWADAGSLAVGDPAASVEIPSQPARFLQYRLTLPAREAEEGERSPAVEAVTLSYAVPNLGPRVRRLTLEAATPENPGEPADPTVAISWEAEDPDGDPLTYDVSWRLDGGERWLTAAEDLTETSFDWNTRGLGDGRYTVRVTASDERANPPGSDRTSTRRSDVFRVDNTPPTIDAEAGTDADGTPRITGTATDAAGTVTSVAFRVDDGDAFRPVNATDLLFDSPEESFELPLPDLDPAEPHVVTLRATDARGNASFQALTLPPSAD